MGLARGRHLLVPLGETGWNVQRADRDRGLCLVLGVEGLHQRPCPSALLPTRTSAQQHQSAEAQPPTMSKPFIARHHPGIWRGPAA
jgi:hypothetical protein